MIRNTSIAKTLFVLLAAALSLSSCLNKETPIPVTPPGNNISASVSLGEDYKLQVFYSLKNNVIVSTNDFAAWDFGFEPSATGWHVTLNSAKFMRVYKTAKSDFAAVTIADTAGTKSAFDMPSGSMDSTAIGDWRGGNVYVVNKGVNESGDPLGMAKIKILSVNATKYTVQFSDIDGSNANTLDVIKDETYNLNFLSIDKGGKTLLIEPPKNQWDIVFTKYTHIYYDLNNMPYSVVGCLLNRTATTAAYDTLHKSFDDVKLDDVAATKFFNGINTIGFDWKTYTGTTYTVNANKFYLIHNADGLYFKLRFVDFYNTSGIKGTPAWQFQRL